MANKPFDYRIINPLERPTSEDLNIAQSQLSDTVRLFARELFENQGGFLGFGFYPYSTSAANAFSLSSGMMFANIGVPVYNIGGIAGVNDPLVYRVQTTDERTIDAAPAPTTGGMKRWDLLQVRFLSADERLTDEQSTGIFNPTLKSFAAQQKYKTLTFDVTTQVPEQIPVGTLGTAVFSYISGNEAATWEAAVKPTATASYYYRIAYIKRYQGQTTITSADIEDARTLLAIPVKSGGSGNFDLPAGEVLLGNGTSGITSTAILPVSKGGTGNNSTFALTGSVAWFDSTTNQIKYTQAVTGLYDTPVSGHLLFSNASGAPTWAAPYNFYEDTFSGAYSNNTVAWTQVIGLELTDKYFRAGGVRIQLQPYNSLDEEDYCIGVNVAPSTGGEVMIKFEITGATSRTFIFPYTLSGDNDSSIAFPFVDVLLNEGLHTITVWGKVKQTTSSLFIKTCSLVASQG